MNGVTQREWSFLLLLRGLSDPRIAELREMPQSFIIKLYSETQVSGCLGMSRQRNIINIVYEEFEKKFIMQ